MSKGLVGGFKSLVDPVSRISEVLFGLIMVLTFTCTISAEEAGHSEIHSLLVGAIGCNLAWGLVDAVMYLMTSLTERGHSLAMLKSVRNAATPDEAKRVIVEALPPMLASLLSPQEFEELRVKLSQYPEPPPIRVNRNDVLASLGIFLLVFLSTFPVVLPFLFMSDPRHALRVSNGIAIGMLFLVGFALGRYAGGKAWRTGIVMVLLSFLLVGITIALGG